MSKRTLIVVAAIALGGCGRSALKSGSARGDDGATDAATALGPADDAPVARATDGGIDGAAADRPAGLPDLPADFARPADLARSADLASPDANPARDGGGDSRDGFPSMLLGLDVTPAMARVQVKTSVAVTLTARFANGSTMDVSALATWVTSDPGVATVAGRTVTGVGIGTATISASVMGMRATLVVQVTDVPLTSIVVDPSDARVAVGARVRFRATALFNDGSRQDVSAQVTWTSSAPVVAALSTAADSAGTATGARAGVTTISATLFGMTGSATLVVTTATLSSIEVAPPSPRIAVGVTQTFTATGVYSDGSTADVTAQAAWSSSDPATLAIAAGGRAMALAAGTSIVTARVDTSEGSVVVAISAAALTSIVVTPATATTATGTTRRFTARGTWADGSTGDLTASALWSSTDVNVASVSNAPAGEGVATALGTGTATIAATFSGMTGQARLSVTAATAISLALAPRTLTLAAGRTAALTATLTFSDASTLDVTATAAWSSSDATIAAVSNTPGGGVTALKPGTVDVSASASGLSDTVRVTITGATLDSIAIKPAPATLAAGSAQAFTATGSFSDGTSLDVTGQATWSSDDARIAVVSNDAATRGRVTGVGAGTTSIHARTGGKDGTAAVTVTVPPTRSLSVSPINPTRHVGEPVQFGASVIYANNTSQDVTTKAMWSSSDALVASVSAVGTARCLSTGAATITASYTGVTDSSALMCGDPGIIRLQVLPILVTILVGAQQPYQAVAIFSDGTTRDVTNLAAWTSSAPAIADVTNNMRRGLTTGVAAGTATITAGYMGFTDDAKLTVSDAKLTGLSVTPALASLRVGQSAQLVAVGLYSDGITRPLNPLATWTTSDMTVADVSNVGARGAVTALKNGTATVTASYGGFSDGARVTVAGGKVTGLSLFPQLATITVGQVQPYQVSALYDDGASVPVTVDAIWTSSDATIADVSNGIGRGQATGLRGGTVTITATFMGFAASGSLTISAAKVTAVNVSPITTTILVGGLQGFSAVAVYDDGSSRLVTALAAWSSSDASIADVSNSNRGLVTGLRAGSAVIRAAFMGLSDSGTVTVSGAKVTGLNVSPITAAAHIGQAQPFVAFALYDDGITRNVTPLAAWSSSDAAVADVTNGPGAGVVTPFKAGTVTIKAAFMGFSDAGALTVSGAKVTGVQVNPATANVPVGQAQSFQAVALYEDGSTANVTSQATWSSSDVTIADISNGVGRGQATGLRGGSVTIKANFLVFSDAATLTVSAAKMTGLQVSPVGASLVIGQLTQYQAVATYDDGTSRNVTFQATWTTSDATVADISDGFNRGQATPLKAGTTTITAAYAGAAASTTLTVSSATLMAIEVSPPGATVPKGLSQQFQAIGLYSDGGSRNITGLCAWASSNATIALVSNAFGTQGAVTGAGAGLADISASFGGVTGKTQVTVTDVTIKEIQVTPVGLTLPRGIPQFFTATAVFSDLTVRNVTAMATWTSSSPTVAQVSNAPRGQAVGLAEGTTMITASYLGTSGSATLTITAATVKEIQVTPAAASTPVGLWLDLTATAVLSDGARLDVTARVTWTSSDATVAAASNAGGSQGRATALKPGVSTITATLQGTRGTTVYTVGAGKLVSIAVTPAAAAIAKGGQLQATATGSYDDGSSQNLTQFATWLSSASAIASVSNADGSRGVITGLAAGTATIDASFGAVKGSAIATVIP